MKLVGDLKDKVENTENQEEAKRPSKKPEQNSPTTIWMKLPTGRPFTVFLRWNI